MKAHLIARSFFILLLLVLALMINNQFRFRDHTSDDIYYISLDGKRLLDGQNTYGRIKDGNMRENDKYPTYFPLTYYFTAAYHYFSPDFNSSVRIWKKLGTVFCLLYTSPSPRD